MWFLTVVARNLIRRKARSLLTVVGAAVAIGTVVALLGVASSVKHSLSGLYAQRGIDLIVLRAGVANRVTSFIPQHVQKDLEAIPDVQSVAPGMLDLISFPKENLPIVPLSGRMPNSVLFRELKPHKGRLLEVGDTKKAMLGWLLAGKLGKEVGDTVMLYEEEFEIVGLFESFTPIENGGVIIPLPELQRLMQSEGKVTGFLIVLDPNSDKEAAAARVKEAAEQIKDKDGKSLHLTTMTTQTHADSAFQIQIMNAVALLTSGIAFILGSVGMLNTMLMSVFERTREIGILRALGWRQSRILWMILWESWVICLLGAVLGIVGAYVIIWGLSFEPTISGILSPWIPPSDAGQGFIVAFVMGFIGGIYPAVRASRLHPTDAVRHE